ncbi:MAG TPA: NB-ARC domain-containing protein [Actinocrinis sp.]|nr:NB-ARC domain-containing protein [Actinospica sp.]HEU5426824.1 NB-ARC domain-containing protein [Actinocrinis sp.]
MGRPERPLDGSGGPIAAFAYDLRALRKQAGNPSYRELARTALFAPSVLSSAASGYRLPTLPVTLGFVTACHGDRDAWEQRWREVAQTVEAADPRGELPRPFEQAASSLARPAQLPMGAGVFVGRKPTLAGAAHVIGQPGPVRSPIVICGPIGVGKSAFALRLADQVAAQFPDGQLYADLSTYPVQDQRPGSSPADSVVRGFLRAMGVPASLLPPEETHRIGLYRSLLAERRLFVLLENPRNERWVRTLVGRTANSQVVVTSRARLLGLDGAYRIDLEAFARQESLALLGRLAGPERVQEEYAAADALAELCGDLPLAVNIIGRKIAARPEWTIEFVAGLLANHDQRVDYLSVGDVSMRDRLTSACRQLLPAGRQALRHLGLVGAGWTTAAELAAAMGVSIVAADGLLETLVDLGLLTRTDVADRYCVSALVGAFAAGLAPAAATLPRTGVNALRVPANAHRRTASRH